MTHICDTCGVSFVGSDPRLCPVCHAKAHAGSPLGKSPMTGAYASTAHGNRPLNVRIRELEELCARAYMRLQNADVPRDPWHWEVCGILNLASPTSDGGEQ
jgi:hypothetical protein